MLQSVNLYMYTYIDLNFNTTLKFNLIKIFKLNNLKFKYHAQKLNESRSPINKID